MALIKNTLKTRISKLEERRAIAPDDNAPLTPEEQYFRLLEGPVSPQPVSRSRRYISPEEAEEAYRQICEGAAKR